MTPNEYPSVLFSRMLLPLLSYIINRLYLIIPLTCVEESQAEQKHFFCEEEIN